MNKGLIAYSVIPFAVILLFLEFGKTKSIDFCDITTEGLALNYTVANDLEQSNLIKSATKHRFASIDLGKSFVGFKEAVAFKESRGDYFTVNTLGYLGKYQFGKGTLKLIGIHDANKFLNDPKLQPQNVCQGHILQLIEFFRNINFVFVIPIVTHLIWMSN